MNSTQTILKRVAKIALTALLAVFFLAPTSAMAETAAGTVISNTASVSWAGGAGASSTVTVTVTLLEAAPTLVFTDTVPAAASIAGTGVGSLFPVTVNYTITSGANGVDTYGLDWANPSNTGVGIPTLDPNGTNATSITDLGGSMVISNTGTTDITVAGLVADHGLVDGDKIVIGAETFTLSDSQANGSNTDFTLSSTPAAALTTGTPVYEQQTISLELVTGTLTLANGDHDLNLTASTTTGSGATTKTADHKIYVGGATLTILKETDKTSAAPGETITYTITVTNAGTANAANVTITDPTPTYTTYVPNSGSYSIDSGAAVSIADGDLTAGLNIGSLASSIIAIITFQVTVD